MGGNILPFWEEAGVRVHRLFGELDTMGFLWKEIAGLVKPDMPVMANSQKLQVNTAQ